MVLQVSAVLHPEYKFEVGDLARIKPVSHILRTFFDYSLKKHREPIVGLIVSASHFNINNVNDDICTVYYVMTPLRTYEMFENDMEKVDYEHRTKNN